MNVAFLAGLLILGSPQQPAAAPPDRIKTIVQAIDERIKDQADLWFDDGDYPACIQLLRFRYDMHPSDYEAATDLGWMLENVQEWNDALSVYQRFRRENPRDADSTFPEANYYFAKGMYEKVTPLLEPSITKKPHPNSFRLLAHAYERLNKLRDSRRVWESYLKLHPTDEAAKRNLERVIKKLGGS